MIHKATKTYYFLFITCLLIWCPFAELYSQTVTSIEQLKSQYLKKDISLEISDHHCDDKLDICYYYLQQTYNDIPIHGYISVASTNKTIDSIVVNEHIAQFKSEPSNKSKKTINDQLIVDAALKKFGVQKGIKLGNNFKSKNRHRVYSNSSISSESITVEEVYFIKNGELMLTSQIAIFIDEENEWWQMRIDPNTGEVLDKNSWTIDCSINHSHTQSEINVNYVPQSQYTGGDSSYTVYGLPLMNPDEGGRTVKAMPWLIPGQIDLPSPYGWHDLDGIVGADTTVTFGNNVYAYPDTNHDNIPDSSMVPDGGNNLCFDFAINLNEEPSTYLDAATTNLFYWNNIVHDVTYNYGFTEAAGNFQESNYGNGGIGNDYVRAESQDGSGLNNANFSTPPDGFRPRMQMFEWGTSKDVEFVINGQDEYQVTAGSYGPASANLTASLVMADPLLGCGALTNSSEVNGKIAIIDRGDCKFARKTLSAQDAGAVAVLICSDGNTLFTMTGDTSASITIPSILATKNTCDIIKVQLQSNTLNASLKIASSINKDSDLDNGVIVHEYGHGISIRLTGGAGNSSCLSNAEQMGEGWSDYFGLMMTLKSDDVAADPVGMATYLVNQSTSGNGIRNYPYSTDMNINPFSYGDIAQVSVPHGVGSIWATMLWDMTWNLIQQHGFDTDIYNGTGGNNIALQLVITALKLQPCNPGFVDGRDAILLADEMINGGSNKCLIWEAFAKRGLGYNADQGSRNSVLDAVESFEPSPECIPILSFEYDVDQKVVGRGDTLTYSAQLLNNKVGALINLNFADTINTPLSYIENSITNGTATDSIINFLETSSDSGTIYSISYKAVADTISYGFVEHIENFESTLTWTISNATGDEGWNVIDSSAYWNEKSIYIDNVDSRQTHYLSKSMVLPYQPLLAFWHQFNTEEFWDGGFVQISTDNGSTWEDLHTKFLLNGYNGILIESSNPDIANKYAFSGNSNGYQLSIIDLTDYAGQLVQIRFVFGSDSAASEDGWYIDGIVIYSSTQIENQAFADADNNDRLHRSTETYILPNCLFCLPVIECPENLINLNIFDQTSYRAHQKISSSGVLDANSLLWLRAGESIDLLPNFEIPSNTTFLADFENCTSPN